MNYKLLLNNLKSIDFTNIKFVCKDRLSECKKLRSKKTYQNNKKIASINVSKRYLNICNFCQFLSMFHLSFSKIAILSTSILKKTRLFKNKIIIYNMKFNKIMKNK